MIKNTKFVLQKLQQAEISSRQELMAFSKEYGMDTKDTCHNVDALLRPTKFKLCITWQNLCKRYL